MTVREKLQVFPDVMRNEDIVQELLIKRDPSPARDVRAACGALVQEAYKRGSGDNLTVILVRIVCQGHPDEAFATKPRNRQLCFETT